LSQSKLLLKRSAAEAGLDEQHAVRELSQPTTFCDFQWHSSGRPGYEQDGAEAGDSTGAAGQPGDPKSTPKLQITKRSTITKNLVIKQRIFMEHFASSPFYLRANQNVDVARYSTDMENRRNGKPKPTEPDEIVLQAIGEKLARDERFIPEELGSNRGAAQAARLAAVREKARKSLADGGGKSTNLEALEKRERKRAGLDEDGNKKEGEEEEDIIDDDLNADDPLEEDGDDYMQDYYASEDEDDGGGGEDGEPVF